MKIVSRLFVAFGLVCVSLSAAESPAAVTAPATPAIKLAVVISIDQLRADYLIRFRPHFVEGGFKRLLEGGADFRNNYYRYAYTITAPGHASIMSGVFPAQHGITANEWLERDGWRAQSNVEDIASPLVGLPSDMAIPTLRLPIAGRSPKNFKATTVGDQLKLRFGPNSKVFAASNKDRSAILMAGKLADAAYWDEAGHFVTSRYYRDALPAWVAAFNAEQKARKYRGSTWDRLLPAAVYDAVQGPDDAPGETTDYGLTRTFPKKIDGGTPELSAEYFDALDNSPYALESLGDFVQRAIKEEQLGRHAATDMLCVSFSQIDSVGHSFGPDSHELMDSMLRLDRILAQLLDTIDREVGLKNCVFVLTSDHGASPLPERVKALRPDIDAGRISGTELDAAMTKALDQAFGPLPRDMLWFTRENSGYHVRPPAITASRRPVGAIAEVIKATLLQQEGIAQAYTRAEMLATPLDMDGESMLKLLRRSYYPPRDRDVVFVLKPYYIIRTPSGTTHGMPYDYDRHVPQLWFGAGVPAGVHLERVGIDDIAPTMSSLLGLPPPPEALGRALF